MTGSVKLNSISKTRRFFQPVKKLSILLYVQMASIGMMIGSAIINAVAFTGGNYLASYLASDGKVTLEGKMRHDKAIEAYNAPYTKYTCDRTKLLDWIDTIRKMKEKAKQDFTNTDYAITL